VIIEEVGVNIEVGVVVECGKYNSGHFTAHMRFVKYGMLSADMQHE